METKATPIYFIHALILDRFDRSEMVFFQLVLLVVLSIYRFPENEAGKL